MGDRANVKIVEEGGGSFSLYTHWGGSRLPETVRLAMNRHGQGRWDDSQYMSRIVLMEMIPEGCHYLETGWGISTNLCDNNSYPIIVMDFKKQEIRFEVVCQYVKVPIGTILGRFSFEDYAAQESADWPETDDN